MGRVCKNVAIFVGYCVSWRLFRQYLFQALAFGACAIYKAARRKFKVQSTDIIDIHSFRCVCQISGNANRLLGEFIRMPSCPFIFGACHWAIAQMPAL